MLSGVEVAAQGHSVRQSRGTDKPCSVMSFGDAVAFWIRLKQEAARVFVKEDRHSRISKTLPD